jgi:hypothetical protein
VLNDVAYLLKDRAVEPQQQPFLGNGSETTLVSRQRPRNRRQNDVRMLGSSFVINKNRRPLLGKVSVNMFPRKLLAYEGRCCLGGPCRRVIRKKIGATNSVLYENLWRKESVGWSPQFREDLNAEIEDSPLLWTVTSERLVKTSRLEKI